jgi:hypothetical protein
MGKITAATVLGFYHGARILNRAYVVKTTIPTGQVELQEINADVTT